MRTISTLLNASRIAVVLISAGAALAGTVDPVNRDGRGIALKGYDAVAYFQQNRPVKGSSEFSFKWMEATWLFSSVQNRDEFAADPQHYAPQYGGYCSYAVSQGHTAPIDPEAWRIVDGKLYLNYSKGVQKTWEKDAGGYIQKANQNWPGLHK
jgi:YHS domain-containing protein